MTPGGSQAWKSHARFSHPPPSDDRGVYDFLPGLLAKTTRWHNGRTRRLAGSDQLQQRPNTFAQTNLSISLFACDKAADHTFRMTNILELMAITALWERMY